MSLADRVLTTLHPKVFYRPCDVAAACHIEVGEAAKILRMLERGGLVEGEPGDGYRRKRLYRSKQQRLAGL